MKYITMQSVEEMLKDIETWYQEYKENVKQEN